MLPNWLDSFFKSFTGGYGFMRFFASNTYYDLLLFLYLSFMLIILYFIIRVRDYNSLFWYIIFILFVILMLFTSSYFYSYSSSGYQPQGRYNMPILPILGLLLYKSRKILDTKIIYIPIILIFTMGVYSFLFVGLLNL
jgi:hypothetical protein